MPEDNQIHPGVAVRQDCLTPHGLTVAEAAKGLGISRKHLSNLLGGRCRITPEMAIRLEKAFGEPAEKWCQIQANYDAAEAMKGVDDIDVERLWWGQPLDDDDLDDD